MITADTITDEQIRELESDLIASGLVDTAYNHDCRWALVKVFSSDPDAEVRYGLVERARARCAEILNARKEG